MTTKTIEQLQQELTVIEAKYDAASESFEYIRVAYENARGELERLFEARNDATAALLMAMQRA